MICVSTLEMEGGGEMLQEIFFTVSTCRWRRTRDGKQQEMEEMSGFETKNLNSLVKVYL